MNQRIYWLRKWEYYDCSYTDSKASYSCVGRQEFQHLRYLFMLSTTEDPASININYMLSPLYFAPLCITSISHGKKYILPWLIWVQGTEYRHASKVNGISAWVCCGYRHAYYFNESSRLYEKVHIKLHVHNWNLTHEIQPDREGVRNEKSCLKVTPSSCEQP